MWGSVLVVVVDRWAVAGALAGLPVSAGQLALASVATGSLLLGFTAPGQSGASIHRVFGCQ